MDSWQEQERVCRADKDRGRMTRIKTDDRIECLDLQGGTGNSVVLDNKSGKWDKK